MAKQQMIRFTVGSTTKKEAEAIESYYEQPISKLLIDKVVVAVKEKAAALPADYRRQFGL